MKRLLGSRFLQAILVLVVTFVIFRFGIQPPAPWSVVTLYMAIVLLSVLVWVSADSDSWRAFLAPIRATLVEERRRPLLYALLGLLPLGVGYYAYLQAAPRTEAPVELRVIHPAPPSSITFRGKTLDIQGLENPLRKDAATLEQHVREGGTIYVRNCVYCHGDNLDGQGHFAHGFSPPPANLADPGTIAMLQESYVFWRIAKGGPGLPKESTPWNSAMPAWEDRLSEEEIWKVVLYLYAATGQEPRRWEHAGGPGPAVASGGGRPPGRTLPGPAAAEAQQAGDVALGRRVYERKCAYCHGLEGKGDGPAAELLHPKPRDFTRGLYKIRSTPSGQVPTDRDLFEVITRGMPGTSMPAWPMLHERERWALVAYMKTLSDRFQGEPPKPVAFPKQIPVSEASIARGKEMYEAIECNKCHGDAGRADGPSAPELEDDWGHPIKPANLTQPWTFRGGPRREDIVRRLATGLMGTPMPTFGETVQDYKEYKKGESEEKQDPKVWAEWKDANLWDLANYVRSLGPERPNWATFLVVRGVEGEIPLDPTAEFWERQPAANIPLVGQVIQDPREFAPTVAQVSVRAVYTSEEVAFHLAWDDPTPSKPDPAKKVFADAVAIQLPVKLEPTERPYFLMGDGARPVYLLTWRSDGGVGEANVTGLGKLTPQRGEAVQARGQVAYADGRYRLVIKRPLETGDANDFAFPAREFFPVAFFAWDGSSGEQGSKGSISSWYYIRVEAPPSRRQFVIPPLVVLLAVVAEVLAVRWARRQGAGSR
ncbi:MAG: c-type cytochrome [Candidatus Rokubacteria bacterium]|nr:c-type cytochrome [Candidatus Rokubacteria bacterium]